MVEGRVSPLHGGRTGEGARGSRWVARGAVLLVALLALVPAMAYGAEIPPHVTPEDGPDACAMCHRAHTAAGVVERSEYDTWETTGSALVLAQPSDTGDAALCLMCHGIDALGSQIEVQSEFLRQSAHSMLPEDARYEGIPAKQCSSCHDAHGSDRRSDNTPYPGLLRAAAEDGDRFYSGDEYCVTCHFEAREGNRFQGLSIYEQTAHGTMPKPASGTQITCSNCHASHGSDIAPLLLSKVLPPAAPTTATVAANDRTQCYACHMEAQATWPGAPAYDDDATATVHGSSEVTFSVSAEYASEEATRLAGECQSCHDAMGADRGDGTPVAKLGELEGREQCYSCHNKENAEDKGVVDMASWGVRPEAIAEEPELIVAWDPENLPDAYGELHVYTRAFGDDAPPYGLEGPRPYAPSDGRTGAMASGNIDGLTDDELVVADPATPVLRVFRSDALAGLSYVSHAVAAPAALLEVGDLLADSTGLPEVAMVSVDGGSGESSLRVYRWQPGGDAGTLLQVGPAYPVGWDATGLAAGDLGLGASSTDLVVTARSAESTSSPDAVFVLSQVSAGDEALGVNYFDVLVPNGTRGPSIGPVLGGAPGIVVANSGVLPPSISLYSPDGVSHIEYPVSADTGGFAWDTAVGTFMQDDKTGVAVAVRNESGPSSVSLLPASASGLGDPDEVSTGTRYATSSLATGSLTEDGHSQIVVANAGVFSRDAGQSVSPSTQVIEWTGTKFEVIETRWGGGAELSGNTPAVLVADLGPVGRSRHPASAIAQAHVSTETAGFERHAECVDCHNVHAATGETTPAAPAAYGAIRGTWGVDVMDSYALVEGIANEYEMCFKCHGKAEWGSSPRDIAAELDTGNAGFHPVMGASSTAVAADTLTDGWTPGEQMHCVDCHGNAGDGPAGPHVSSQAPLLSKPYIGALPGSNSMLCYGCHKQAVYRNGDTGSEFFDLATAKALHSEHVSGHGLGCESCHIGHGTKNNVRLLRDEIGWEKAADGGGCATPCHEGGEKNVYTRTAP